MRPTVRTDVLALLVSDAFAVSTAFAVYHEARFTWQWFGRPDIFPMAFWAPMALLVAFFGIFFLFFGLYRERFAASRLEEIGMVLKAVTVGFLTLIFAIYLDALQPGSSRTALFFFASLLFVLVSAGRVLIRSVQKRLLLRGLGRHKALIVGRPALAKALQEDVQRYPEAGLEVAGMVAVGEIPPECDANVFLDVTLEGLSEAIDKLGVRDVLIALSSSDHALLQDILQCTQGRPVATKLVPDFYAVVSGMARTEHIYGLPLIEVLSEPMPPWQQSTKRLMDVGISLFVIGFGLPLWITLVVAIRLTSPGPAIFRQTRIGQHGKPFTMLKFRTMRQDAEAHTGPVWATENDPRYTPLGRWLRKTRLDEIPQCLNVLRGEMSLVGPRPERPFFVEKLQREIPLYHRRHRVKPGITGWAQVKRPYDQSVEDVRFKVKYDLFYTENQSLKLDLTILLYTLRTTLLGKGQ